MFLIIFLIYFKHMFYNTIFSKDFKMNNFLIIFLIYFKHNVKRYYDNKSSGAIITTKYDIVKAFHLYSWKIKLRERSTLKWWPIGSSRSGKGHQIQCNIISFILHFHVICAMLYTIFAARQVKG